MPIITASMKTKPKIPFLNSSNTLHAIFLPSHHNSLLLSASTLRLFRYLSLSWSWPKPYILFLLFSMGFHSEKVLFVFCFFIVVSSHDISFLAPLIVSNSNSIDIEKKMVIYWKWTETQSIARSPHRQFKCVVFFAARPLRQMKWISNREWPVSTCYFRCFDSNGR